MFLAPTKFTTTRCLCLLPCFKVGLYAKNDYLDELMIPLDEEAVFFYWPVIIDRINMLAEVSHLP